MGRRPKSKPKTEPVIEDERPLAEQIAEQTGFDIDLIEAALEVGYIKEQIVLFPDAEGLKQQLIHVRPALALRFRPVPSAPKPAKEPQCELSREEFEVTMLAGGGPPSFLAAQEQRQIEIQMRNRRVGKVQSIYITRSFTPDAQNRFHSLIEVEYLKEVPTHAG